MPHINSEYFNLHTTGVGYVNRFREVPLKHGKPFYSVRIAALHGSVDNPKYTKIDCRISGAEALERLRSLETDINTEMTKVLVGFNIGDIYLPDPFQYKSGDKQRQTACMIKGRPCACDGPRSRPKVRLITKQSSSRTASIKSTELSLW
jgi:hypothetical protein